MGTTPIETSVRERHWDNAYVTRGAEGVSWFQTEPSVSLELINTLDVDKHAGIIDVGGGASCLVDRLVADGWQDLAVLDISAAALETARGRVASNAPVTWIHEDLLTWSPQRRYGLWHDRAVLHFLVDPAERSAYLHVMCSAIKPGGALILATFAPDGPESCSGLPVRRYAADDLMDLLGDSFEIVESRRHEHITPTGASQAFTWIAARALRST